MNNNNKIPSELMAGLEPLSRRKFLRGALVAGTGAASVFASGCSVIRRDAPTPEPIVAPSGALTADEYATLHKMAKVIIPTQAYGLPSIDEIGVMENVDVMVSNMSGQVRGLLALGIRSFDTGSAVTTMRFRRFSKLSDQDALTYVNDWHTGFFFQRGLITALKSLVTVNYWRDPRTHDFIEFDGPVSEKWGIPRLGNAPLPRA